MKKLKAKGVTLIELVVVFVVLGITATVIGPILSNANRSANMAIHLNTAGGQGRLAITRITGDLKNILTITSASSTSITFTDVNGDDITYTYDAADDDITRTEDPQGDDEGPQDSDLAKNVTAFSINYYNGEGNVEADIDDMQYVRAEFTVTEGGHSQDFRSTIFMRNKS